jgi:hypothetical protein
VALPQALCKFLRPTAEKRFTFVFRWNKLLNMDNIIAAFIVVSIALLAAALVEW